MFDPQRWNRYTYALNSPMTYTDPSGLNPILHINCNDPGARKEFGDLCTPFGALPGEMRGGSTTPQLDWLETPLSVVPGRQPTQNPDPPRPETPTPETPKPETSEPPPGPDDPWKWKCLKSNYAFSWKATNKEFFEWPWKAARTGAGLLTGGAVARSTGLTSPGMVLGDLWRGGVKEVTLIMGVPAIAKSVAASVGTNMFLGGVSLEVGITVGSGLDAAYQTYVSGRCR
jgi:hypothetical protein